MGYDLPVNISHRVGEVLILALWDTHTENCKIAMSLCQRLIADHEDTNVLRVEGLLLMGSKKLARNYIESNRWHSIRHLAIDSSKPAREIMEMFKAERLPFICIVGKDGKIRYLLKSINEIVENLRARVIALLSDLNDCGDSRELSSKEDHN